MLFEPVERSSAPVSILLQDLSDHFLRSIAELARMEGKRSPAPV